MFLEQLSLLIVITPTPPPSFPIPTKKNAFRVVVLMLFSAKGNSDKTHRTLNALARGFGKERKGNYHASKSDFR